MIRLDLGRLMADDEYLSDAVSQVVDRLDPDADHVEVARFLRREMGADSAVIGALAGPVLKRLRESSGAEAVSEPVPAGPFPDPGRLDLTEYCEGLLREDANAKAGEVLAFLKERGRWNGDQTDQAFYTGPWRKAIRAIRFEAAHVVAAAPRPKESPGALPSPTADDCILYRSAAGSFTAKPAPRGRWKIELAVEVDRTTALSLQGQAFALLYPREET